MTQAGLRTGSNGVPAGGHGALPAGPFYPAKMDLSAAIDTALRSAERQKCRPINGKERAAERLRIYDAL